MNEKFRVFDLISKETLFEGSDVECIDFMSKLPNSKSERIWFGKVNA